MGTGYRQEIKSELIKLTEELLSFEYKLEDVYFLDKLPKNPSKKLDKKTLRAMLQTAETNQM